MHCPSTPSLAEGYKQFADITNRYPRAACHRCLAFEPNESHVENVRGVIVVPEVGDQDVYARKVMEDFAEAMLSTFHIMAGGIEKKNIIQTPTVPPSGIHPNSNVFSSPTDSPSSTPLSLETVARIYRGTSSPGVSGGTFRSQTPDQLTRKRTPGRAHKLLGDLYLLSGKVVEALRSYVQAVDLARSNSDHLWQASATEGLCCAAALLAASDVSDIGPLPPLNSAFQSVSLTSSFSSSSDSVVTTSATQLRAFVRDVPNHYSELVTLYEKAKVWPLVYAEACLKMARWSANMQDKAGSNKVSEVAQWIARGWTYASQYLTTNEQVHFATAAAEIFGIAGAMRKRAFWLRRVTALLFPMLKQEADQGVEPDQALQKRVLACLARICPAYGIENFNPVQFGRAEALAALMDDWETDADVFGWPRLQVEVLRECIAVSETLGDYDGVIHYATLLLRYQHHLLLRDEQSRVISLLQRLVQDGLAETNTASVDVVWWRESFFRGLEIARPAASRIPHPKKRLGDQEEGKSIFLFDPYARRGNNENTGTLLVVGEVATVLITVWNPFMVDLELQSVELNCDGVDMDFDPCTAIIPSASVITLRLNGYPAKPGELIIRGVRIIAFGGLMQEFAVISMEDEKAIQDERKKFEIARKSRNKRLGLLAYDEKQLRSKRDSMSVLSFNAKNALKVQTIESMPLMRVKSTSLAHGAMMLFEGESAVLTITLENISKIPVDFVLPSFTETASASSNQPKNPRQSREDMYESDTYAATTYAFEWERPAEEDHVSIQPGGEYVIHIKVFGKRSCAGGTINIDYGYHLTNSGDTIYTRQVTVPVMLTVRKSLDLVEVDALAFRPGLFIEKDNFAELVRNMGSTEGAKKRCLLAIDVRNTWSASINLTFVLKHDQENHAPVEQTFAVQPGSTKRVILPIKRILLDHEHATQAIPMAANKQFIVAKVNKANPAAEELTRKLFWYKEALLQLITANWSCSPGRSGALDLRLIRLAEPMLDALSAPAIGLDVHMHNMPDTLAEHVNELSPGKYTCSTMQLVRVVYTVINRQKTPVKCFLRIQPMLDQNNGKAECNLDDYLLYSGQLQFSLIHMEPEQEYRHDESLCFLAGGNFTFTCHVEECTTKSIYQGPMVTMLAQA